MAHLDGLIEDLVPHRTVHEGDRMTKQPVRVRQQLPIAEVARQDDRAVIRRPGDGAFPGAAVGERHQLRKLLYVQLWQVTKLGGQTAEVAAANAQNPPVLGNRLLRQSEPQVEKRDAPVTNI